MELPTRWLSTGLQIRKKNTPSLEQTQICALARSLASEHTKCERKLPSTPAAGFPCPRHSLSSIGPGSPKRAS